MGPPALGGVVGEVIDHDNVSSRRCDPRQAGAHDYVIIRENVLLDIGSCGCYTLGMVESRSVAHPRAGQLPTPDPQT